MQQTNEVLLLFDDYLLNIPEIEHHLSNVTTTESNGKISISLYNRRERSKDVWQISDDIRTFAKTNLGDVKVRVNEIQSSVTGVSGGKTLVRSPIQIELKGSDMSLLIKESEKVQKIFQETAGIKDIKSSYTEGVPELKVTAGTGMLFISFIKNPSLPLNFTVISVSCPRLFGSLANTPAFLPDTAAEKDFTTLARVVP